MNENATPWNTLLGRQKMPSGASLCPSTRLMFEKLTNSERLWSEDMKTRLPPSVMLTAPRP